MIPSLHRPTKAVVDLDAISQNIQLIQEQLPYQTLTYAVVKANAYGHGATVVAKHIIEQVDGFCVSNLDEGIELRQAGIRKPILVLGVVLPEELPLAKGNDLSLTVASLDWVESALPADLNALKVHIKIDSGMGRIGFRHSQETNRALHRLQIAGAHIEGVFTHFATADTTDDRQFQSQLSDFKKHLSQLDNVPPLVHASNSATSIWHHEGIFNMVRLGVAIYGLNPSDGVLPLPLPLKPAFSLTSQLVHVKTLEADQTIGYGATYRTKTEEVIGVVPIGYADGWTRDSQNFHVLVDGQFCDIVGRISMDQMTIRLPKVYPLGTTVTLIGSDGDEVLLATDVAAHRQTIGYEVLCLLSDRIPREYKQL